MERILKKNILNMFIEKIKAFPLWIKQVIFLRLYEDLKNDLSEDFIKIDEKDLYCLYAPPLSYKGKTEMSERTKKLDKMVYDFLECIDEGMSIIEIALSNFLTLEEVSKCFITAIEEELVKPPIPIEIFAMAGFMSGKFRTGEYFKRIGKINVDQLEQTIITQRRLVAEGKDSKIAQVMIDLGYITEKDTESLVKIKTESKKRFILDPSIVPEGVASNDSKYVAQIEELKKQNLILRAKLQKLLIIFKKK